jgi:hypothetical protein
MRHTGQGVANAAAAKNEPPMNADKTSVSVLIRGSENIASEPQA